MAECEPKADSACNNILQFPVRNKGRVRKSKGAQAEGVGAMLQFGIYPPNVAHFEQESFDDIEIEELLAYAFDAMRASLPAETNQRIVRTCLIDAALSDNPRKRRLAAALSGRFKG